MRVARSSSASVGAAILGLGLGASGQPLPSGTTCTDPQGSEERARAAREASRAGNHVGANQAWEQALALCPAPDLYEGLGRTLESLAATALNEADRLRSLERALGAYREAVRRLEASPIEGYSPAGLLARASALEATVGALRRRLSPAPDAAPSPAPPPPIGPQVGPPPVCSAPRAWCGELCVDFRSDAAHCGRCDIECGQGDRCVDGACRPAVVAAPGTAAPSRVVPWTMVVSGGVLASLGGVFLGLGLAARSDAARYAGQLCEETTAPMCYQYASGATRPEEVASWAVPLGAVVLGLGVVDAAIGTVLLLRGRSPEGGSGVTGFMMPGGGGVALRGTF